MAPKKSGKYQNLSVEYKGQPVKISVRVRRLFGLGMLTHSFGVAMLVLMQVLLSFRLPMSLVFQNAIHLISLQFCLQRSGKQPKGEKLPEGFDSTWEPSWKPSWRVRQALEVGTMQLQHLSFQKSICTTIHVHLNACCISLAARWIKKALTLLERLMARHTFFAKPHAEEGFLRSLSSKTSPWIAKTSASVRTSMKTTMRVVMKATRQQRCRL